MQIKRVIETAIILTMLQKVGKGLFSNADGAVS